MGLVFEDETNVMLSTGADVLLILVMGGIMLFFLKLAREFRRSVFFYLAAYLGVMVGWMMFYANKASQQKRKWRVEEYEWLSFFGMYTVALLALMGTMQSMDY